MSEIKYLSRKITTKTSSALIDKFKAEAKANPDPEGLYFKNAKTLMTANVSELLLRLGTTTNLQHIAVIHKRLLALDVPPVLRPEPPHQEADKDQIQLGFLIWYADLQWIAKKYPKHRIPMLAWKTIFIDESKAPYIFKEGRRPIWYFVKELGILEEQQQDLALLVGRDVRNKRNPVMGDAGEKLWERLAQQAIAKPDLSGKVKPELAALRRYRLYRLAILTAGSASSAYAWYCKMYTDKLSKKAALAIIQEARVWAGEAATKAKKKSTDHKKCDDI